MRAPRRRRLRGAAGHLGAVGLLIAVVLSVSGCAQQAVRHTVLKGNLEPLRAAFNRDVGKVRAVILASPT